MTDDVGHTYEAAARLCEVTAETIRHRARRGSIKRGRKTNSDRPTVLLTEAELQTIRAGHPFHRETAGQPDGRPDEQLVVRPDGQPKLVVMLRDQPARAEAHVDRLEDREAELRTTANRQAQKLIAALIRTAIAETEAQALREAAEAPSDSQFIMHRTIA